MVQRILEPTALDSKNLFRLHHVGIVTSTPEKAQAVYLALGYQETKSVHDPNQLSDIVLLASEHGPLVELVTPSCEQSPAHAWLKRIKGGVYHSCYAVADLDAAMDYLAPLGLRPVTKPAFSPAFDTRVVFTWGAPVGLVELIELPS